MQTVNFQCGHCGKLMAVGTEYLGLQVRCPHCQQVVVAPQPTLTPSADPSPALPPTLVTPLTPPAVTQPGELEFSVANVLEEHESIFGKVVSDDLMDDREAQPRLELPPEPAPPSPGLEATSFQVPGLSTEPPPAPPSPYSTPTATWAPPPEPAAAPYPFGGPIGGSPPPGPSATNLLGQSGNLWAPTSPSLPATEALGPEDRGPVSQVGLAPAPSTGTGTSLVLIFLIPYAVLMTAVAITYYIKWYNKPHPFELVPDYIGSFKDATKKKGGAQSFRYPIAPDGELPDRLRVELGKSIRLGDLEVTPEKVERKRILYKYRRNYEPQEAEDDSLVLHLRLRNVSKDVIFNPTDPWFERRWQSSDPASNKPFTLLEVGDRKRFYGGPVDWKRVTEDGPIEYIEGQESNNRELKPGEQISTLVCTNPQDRVADYVQNFKGKLTWRVQLRRGLVPYASRDIPATAVVGVTFTGDEIRKQ